MDGALEPIPESPYIFPRGLYGLAVSPDGRFLAVGQWFDSSIALYEVDSVGRLTPAPGSPFGTDFGLATNLQFNCDGDSLYVTESDASLIDVFAIDPTGRATRVSRIPLVSLGGNPSDFLLTPNGQYLFATDLDTNIIHAFKIGANRVFEKVPGSPFKNSVGRQPNGLAINATGTILYVANLNDTISVFRIESGGTLTARSLFELGQGASPAFIAGYPSNGCDVTITHVEVKGKKLYVFGNNFDDGSIILLEGEEQNTKNDIEDWTTELIGKKAGKRINVGPPVSIKVRTATGRTSQAFRFERTP